MGSTEGLHSCRCVSQQMLALSPLRTHLNSISIPRSSLPSSSRRTLLTYSTTSFLSFLISSFSHSYIASRLSIPPLNSLTPLLKLAHRTLKFHAADSSTAISANEINGEAE